MKDDVHGRSEWCLPLPLVFPGPGRRAVEIANPCAFQHGGLEVRSIDCNRVAGTPFSVLVVCDAPASLATEIRTDLSPPGVLREPAGRGLDSDGCRLEISPESTVTATDRAVASRNRSGCPRDVNANGTAVTSCRDFQVDISRSGVLILPQASSLVVPTTGNKPAEQDPFQDDTQPIPPAKWRRSHA